MNDGEELTVIINGEEVADPDIYNSFAPDALERVEVLGREASASFGTNPAGQVVNFVVRRQQKERYVSPEAKMATNGGTARFSGKMDWQALKNSNVDKYSLTASHQSILLAEERPEYLIQFPDKAGTSLLPRDRSIKGAMALQRKLGEWSASLNADASASETLSRSLRSGERVDNLKSSQDFSIEAKLWRRLGDWSLRTSLAGSYGFGQSSGAIKADTETGSARAHILARGTLARLPAGPIRLNTNATGAYAHSSTRRDGSTQTSQSEQLELDGTLQIPLLPRSKGPFSLKHPGQLDLSLRGNWNGSNAGGGQGGRIATSWRPSKIFQVSGSWSVDYRALNTSQITPEKTIGDPVTVYDFTAGQSVQVDQILGGNPELRTPRQERWQVRAHIGPFTEWKLKGSVSLNQSDSVNEIGRISEVTASLEEAFPDLFLRDENGQLIAIDKRPVNFASSRKQNANAALSFSIPLGEKRGDRLNLSLNQNWALINSTRFKADLPETNRLSGDGGGVSRRRLRLNASLQKGPWDASASLQWQSRYRIRNVNGVDGNEDLIVSPAQTVNLGLGYKIRDTLFPDGPEKRGRDVTRAELDLHITNLFDTRLKGRLANGEKAVGYDKDSVDPMGRTVSLKMRYRF